jgi:hypothetical protein
MKLSTIFCFFSLICFVGCEPSSSKIYTNELMGLQLEIPSNWDYEEPERISALSLKPSSGQDKEFVSIIIVSSFANEKGLVEAIENEVNRLENKWVLDEVAIIEPIEESTLNDFEFVRVTIEAPEQLPNGEKANDSTSFQPMDILILDAGDRFIEIYFRKSTVNPDLNDEGQNIVNSIRAYP